MLDCRKGKYINLGVLCDNINFSLLMLIAILEETFLHVATREVRAFQAKLLTS